MARQARSCQKRWTAAPRAVQALHNPTPNAITARRERRSPMTPSGSAASDSTMTYAEPHGGQRELALDVLEQREDDVAVGVVEQVDEREKAQGVGRVRPGTAVPAVRVPLAVARAGARQWPPPRARRGPPSPPGTPRSTPASSPPAGDTDASSAAVSAGRARRRRAAGNRPCCRGSRPPCPAACPGPPYPS